MIRDREPILLLEGNGGKSFEVSADDFVERVAELTNRPNLVVLASCQSAGQGDAATTEDGGVLAALGPRLAAAGVPAVIAMQGNVTMGTVQEFMPAFFTALATDGLIDRAVSLARGTIRERPDAWVPVLFMRLKSGGLWNDVGFIDGDVFQQWPELMSAVKAGGCTPLLGPGLVEAILGSRRELALALSDEWDVPLAPADRDDLPQVAQFLAIRRSRTFLERAVLQYAGKRIRSRYSEGLPADCDVPLDELSDRDLRVQVATLIQHAWTSRVKSLGPDPYRGLAELPFPLYLSTNFDPLLETALRTQELKGESREPVRAVCKWNSRVSPGTAQVTDDPQYRPTARAPLVFHMLGHLEIERSMVLTQDDYFDALIAATSREQLPQLIRTALTDRALLFLGFQIDDWSFRVLFRFLMNLEGADMLRDYPHVAVQIDPEEQRFRTPRDARKYLTEYFGAAGAARVSIYWGSTEDFIRELLVKFRLRYG